MSLQVAPKVGDRLIFFQEGVGCTGLILENVTVLDVVESDYDDEPPDVTVQCEHGEIFSAELNYLYPADWQYPYPDPETLPKLAPGDLVIVEPIKKLMKVFGPDPNPHYAKQGYFMVGYPDDVEPLMSNQF